MCLSSSENITASIYWWKYNTSFQAKIKFENISASINLTSSQYLKTLLTISVGILTDSILCVCADGGYIMKCVNIWNICMTPWINILKVINAEILQNCIWKNIHPSTEKWDINLTKYKKFCDIVLDSTLQLTLRKYHLSSFVRSKEDWPLGSEKAIKLPLLFQLHI